jgi:uncharacterized protein YcbX
MLGERLDQANVGPGGIAGDRQWAVVDAETGVSLSAKRYADLLKCQAWTGGMEVIVRLPNGREHPTGSSDLARGLSELLGRHVTTRSARSTKTIQHEFPTAITEGEGEPFLWEPGTQAFVDSTTLQLLTTGTLAELQRLHPASNFHRARFRPNFLLETSETGFVENNWVNKEIMLGSLRCQVTDHTQRCVMVTRGQGDLPLDTGVIRTVLKYNDGNAGVALQTPDTGILYSGAEVELLK